MQITKHNTPFGSSYSITQMVKGKFYKFTAHKHGLCWDKEYDYQVITKCKAGFFTVSTGKSKLCNIVTGYKTNKLHTVQIKNEYGTYLTALAMKGGKFYIIDKEILENLTVGDIHSNFPAMADYEHWKNIGSKTWADLAYGPLNKSTDTVENPHYEFHNC